MAMAAGWEFFLWTCLPLPAALLALLTMPGASLVRAGVLRATSGILGARVQVGTSNVKLLYVFVFVVGIVFLACTSTCLRLNAERATVDSAALSTNQRTAMLARQWRADRNWWISLFALTLWYLLARVFAMGTKLARLEKAEKDEKAR